MYKTAERVCKEVGEVSVLVNNAGVVSGHHLLECPDELIERTMMVNCHAHFWVNILISSRMTVNFDVLKMSKAIYLVHDHVSIFTLSFLLKLNEV